MLLLAIEMRMLIDVTGSQSQDVCQYECNTIAVGWMSECSRPTRIVLALLHTGCSGLTRSGVARQTW